ncbi:MAG: hypothetical protein BWY28_01953 [bacterium ADurb.Bin236]|nr:MAG: hypothetical protein BWY28_01953 [bacterium ADurb.Bin236]
MDYRDVALMEEQMAELKKGWRKTAWRMKILKPAGAKALPAAQEATEVVKVDPDVAGAQQHPYHTVSGKYKKIIHDEKRNRTFLLHDERLDSESNAIVSIINHDEEPGSGDYIDVVNAGTCGGWPGLFGESDFPYDIAFNPDKNQLAIATGGAGTPGVGGTGVAPCLIIIDCAKEKNELFTGQCNRLSPNDNYLECETFYAPRDIIGTTSACCIKFVRYYRGRWWVWAHGAGLLGGGDPVFRQLGYFTQAGEYSFVMQHGWIPTPTQINHSGELFDSSVTVLNQPSISPMGHGALLQANGTIGGDVALPFYDVGSFEVQDSGAQGEILMVSNPNSTYPVVTGGYYEASAFGVEPFIFRLDIERLLAGTSEAVHSYVAELESEVVSLYVETASDYYLFHQVAGFDIRTVEFEGVVGAARVQIEQAHTGGIDWVDDSDDFNSDALAYSYIEGDYGTSFWSDDGDYFPEKRPVMTNQVVTCNSGSLQIRIGANYKRPAEDIPKPEYLGGGVWPAQDPFTLRFPTYVYPYPCNGGIVDCIDAKSDAPLMLENDDKLPEKDYLPGGAESPLKFGKQVDVSGVHARISNGITYSEEAGAYAFPAWAASIADGFGEGAGLWRHTGDKLTRHESGLVRPSLTYDSDSGKYVATCCAIEWNGIVYSTNVFEPTGTYCAFVNADGDILYVGSPQSSQNPEPKIVLLDGEDFDIDGEGPVNATLARLFPGTHNTPITLLYPASNAIAIIATLMADGHAIDKTINWLFVGTGAGKDYILNDKYMISNDAKFIGGDGANGERTDAEALAFNKTGAIARLTDNHALVVSRDELVNVGVLDPFPVTKAGSPNLAIQIYDLKESGFLDFRRDAELEHIDDAISDVNAGISGAFVNFKNRSMGFFTGKGSQSLADNARGEIWIWQIEKEEGEGGGWSRDPRVWWDGSAPDIIMGAGATHPADAFGQPATFFAPRWSQSKGQASCRFSFGVRGAEYLPWARSSLNESEGLPGSYDGALQDMSRLNVERGVWDGAEWTWITEGQAFIAQSPAEIEEGAATMEATAMGAIATFVTRSVYQGYHSPELKINANVLLTSDDGLTYRHEDENGRTTDLASRPEPAVFADGEQVAAYSIDLASGEVVFDEDMSEKAITATFNSYVPGTNEAEDIIVCALTYPQELGGCGLDMSYLTRTLSEAKLERESAAVWRFPKNNILRNDERNRVRVNGAEMEAGRDYEWEYRAGRIVFASPPAEGALVEGDCAYCSIQKSGVTLRPLSLKPKTHNTTYDAINEVCRLVAPNYILREGRDGKIECDYFAQKPRGGEDATISDGDIVIMSLECNPAYEAVATRALSFGTGRIEELPDYCRGAEVEDVWPHGWHPGADVSSVTDGDPATGVTGGYGKWGEPGEGLTLDVQNALAASEPDGTPALLVDMGELREPETIVVARPSQVSTEGEVGGVVQIMSVWGSADGDAFVRMAEPFHAPPGGNVHLKAGVNFDRGVNVRYLRVNIHSLGLYKWGRDKTHSQIGISEIQCYPDTTIMGEARLQSEDPGAPLYDRWGLLEKHGLKTHVARGGAEDAALTTQAKVDLDARYTLEEIVRLVSRVSIRSPWLPGVPVFSTIRVINKALGVDETFFVEDRSATEDGDEFGGATLA